MRLFLDAVLSIQHPAPNGYFVDIGSSDPGKWELEAFHFCFS